MKAYIDALMAPTPLLSWAVLSVLFTLSGSYGGFENLTLLPRFGFWAALFSAAFALGIALRLTIDQLRPGIGYLPASVLAAAMTGLVLAAVLPRLVSWLLDLQPARLPAAAEIAVVTLVIGSSVALLRHLLERRILEASASQPQQNRLLARLPEAITGEVLHLSVSDHYVEVATDRGTGRLLMRFSDAINEVSCLDGLRVHRSHWVARCAVARVVRERGRTFLVLRNGTRVPVSRAYLDAVGDLAGA